MWELGKVKSYLAFKVNILRFKSSECHNGMGIRMSKFHIIIWERLMFTPYQLRTPNKTIYFTRHDAFWLAFSPMEKLCMEKTKDIDLPETKNSRHLFALKFSDSIFLQLFAFIFPMLIFLILVISCPPSRMLLPSIDECTWKLSTIFSFLFLSVVLMRDYNR